MTWHQQRLAGFDIETTGVNPEQDRIVTAAVSVVGGGSDAEEHSWLLDPGIEIPQEAAAVHGITTEVAREQGQSPQKGIEEITAVLAQLLANGIPIIAFNARFDLTMLDREARRYELMPLIDRIDNQDGMLVIDPFVIDKQFDRYRRGKRTLTAVCEHHRVPLDGAHAANADALAAARLAYRLGEGIAELQALDLKALHSGQVAWAAEQAASLQEYFQSQGRDEHVEGAWPIVPCPN